MAAYKTRVMPGEDYPSHLVAIYDYITHYSADRGYPPSVRELTGIDPANTETYQQGFASSTSVMRYYLGKMDRFGMIAVTPRVSRGIRLIQRKDWKKYATATPKILKVDDGRGNPCGEKPSRTALRLDAASGLSDTSTGDRPANHIK